MKSNTSWKASHEIYLYVVLATNALLVRGAHRSYPSFETHSISPMPDFLVLFLHANWYPIDRLLMAKTGHRA